jgi:hypothetical protein
MQKITLAVATAAAMMMAAPLLVGTIPAKAENLTIAQSGIDVQIGRDRDERVRRERRHENSDVTVGVGASGVVVGPRGHCRTVTTMVEKDNGRREKRTERRCD